MRKNILLPGLAVVGGIVGFFLRRWELASAFEADTGLPIPGAPATWVLIAFSAAMAVGLFLLCRGKHRSFSGGYDQAFCAKGNTLYISCMVLAAFVLLGAAVLLAAGFPGAYRTAMAGPNNAPPLLAVLPRALLIVLSAASCFCILITGKNNYRGEKRGKYSFPLLVPAYTFCIWLIAAYQVREGDPVQLNYIYELFAIIASLLGLYFIAGFSFERAKVTRASLFALLGVYFSLVTLADGHELWSMLLYGFAMLYLLTNIVALLFNDARPERARMPRAEEAEETDEFDLTDTEVTPDE